MLWVYLGPRLRHKLCQLTTQHNTLPIQTVTLWDAAQFPALQQQPVSQSVCCIGMCCINWWYFGNTDIILSDKYRLYLPPNNPPDCGRSVELATLVRSTERREMARTDIWWSNTAVLICWYVVQQHNTGTAAQYWYSSTIPVQQHNTGTAAQYWYSSTIPVQRCQRECVNCYQIFR